LFADYAAAAFYDIVMPDAAFYVSSMFCELYTIDDDEMICAMPPMVSMPLRCRLIRHALCAARDAETFARCLRHVSLFSLLFHAAFDFR